MAITFTGGKMKREKENQQMDKLLVGERKCSDKKYMHE
jgi:hypothetical protein